MNDKKVSFIISTNNELYYDECVWYINHLDVPDDYEMEIICITEADSMADAYNAGMNSSDAKYKVYLHQDVFIYNHYFIKDIINIFTKNEELGLLGMLGGVNLPQNAITWNAWNRGRTLACNNKAAFCVNGYQNPGTDWTETEAVDGMVMITQYDIPWRDDLDLGWDFYDISQSLEFRRRGYKVGVPYQEQPWCMHDCGYSKLSKYDVAREKVLREYTDYFSGEYEPQYDSEMYLLQDAIFQKIKRAIEEKNYAHALQIMELVQNNKIEHNDLQYALNLLEIYQQEGLNEKLAVSFFKNIDSWEALKQKYDIIKFAVRHLYNRTNIELVDELIGMIKREEISKDAVMLIAQHSVA